ncbi:hypothetical protein BJY52DRAFT_861352 [Lactarius psammicola]|nr:hypothetical protein BJY52DRAFT_861352 [Lactarius psammicola]
MGSSQSLQNPRTSTVFPFLEIIQPPPMPSADTIVGSGSVQSHLSVLNSHSRHREHARPPVVSSNTNISEALTPADSEQPKDYSQYLVSLIRGPLKDPLLPGPDGSLPRQRVFPNSFRWIISVYVAISLIFFSTSLYRSFHSARLDDQHSLVHSQDRSPALSGLDALSPAARFAKLFALYPPPTHFRLFTHRPAVGAYSHEITVCLWAHENNLDWVPSWTTDWPGNDLHHSYFVLLTVAGPISLVVLSRKPPTSNRAPLRPPLAHLLHHPLLNASRLALHTLHLGPTTPDAPNVFLNLARLFAPTRTVLLVPGTPTPPEILPTTAWPFAIPRLQGPVIINAHASTTAPPRAAGKGRPETPLTPVLIPRDHPLWCTERFAFVPAYTHTSPRAADWEACLWQVQLETYGVASADGPTLPRWRWNVEPSPVPPVPAPSSAPVLSAIRRRLDVRFRAETCVLAIKRHEVLSEEWRGGRVGRVSGRRKSVDWERMRWLHEICREWSHGV